MKELSLFKRSLWVFHLNTGACNACDIEVLDVLTPRHDVERLGVKLVGSPRHADALLITGPVTVKALPFVIEAIKSTPSPKVVIAIGSCACSGGIFHDSYAVIGGVPKLYEYLEKCGEEAPPTVYVPGCPPKPEAIIYGVCLARRLLRQKQRREIFVEEVKGEPPTREAESPWRIFSK